MSITEDCRDLELIGLHIPKTGGTALLRWLEKVYGREALYPDSDDNENPANISSVIYIDPEGYLKAFASGYPFLRGKKVVHGHFWMKKYQHITQNVPRITFLRNPVDRLISEYWNIKNYGEGWKMSVFEIYKPIDKLIRKYRAWNRKIRKSHMPMHLYFLRKSPSLLDFARMPLNKNYYGVTFLGDIGPERYDFIGDYARFDDEVKRLKALLDVDSDISPPKENITSNKDDGYRRFKEGVLNDAATMGRLKELLSDDIAFYEKYAGR